MHRNSLIDQPWWRLRHGHAWLYLTARDYPRHISQTRVADPLIKKVARYLRLLELGGEYVAAAAQAFPRIARAFALQGNRPLVDDLRLMLLGQLDEAEILARTGVTTKDLRTWRRIFCDVRPQLDEISWHINHIVTPEVEAGNLYLAGRLHLALCGGPQMARRLLDGPGTVPEDPDEYARYVLTEAQIASGGLLLSPPESRKEMEIFMKLALQMSLANAKTKLLEKQLAARVARDQRRHELAERRVRAAEVTAEAAAARAAAKVKSLAEKEIRDRELAIWHREQQAALESRLQAERQARIEQSPLQQLQWATCQDPRSSPVTQAVVAPGSPAKPLPRSTKKRPSGQRRSTSASLRRVIAEAVDPQPAVAEPSSSLAP